MFFQYDAKQITKCKVSKFIKVPFVKVEDPKPPQCDINTNAPLPLYIITRSNHRTIFCTKNNIVYFYERFLNSNVAIVPLYDYKRENYYLTKLDIVDTDPIYSIINHFRASNGETYSIYSTRNKDESAKANETVVYNHTKNKFIYRRPYKILDTYTFRIPIANSLLISLSSVNCDIWINIIDVTKEKKDENEEINLLPVSLGTYFVNIADYMSSQIAKTYISRLRKIADNIFNLKCENVGYIWPVTMSVTAGIQGDDTVFYKGFQLRFEEINIKSLRAVVKNAFAMSFTLEGDRIVIRMGTGKGGHIKIKKDIINIPPDVYWVVGEYKLKGEYDLSKSQLYSVSKVSKEYIIIDGMLCYPNPNIPKTYQEYTLDNKITYMFQDNEISIISRPDSNDSLLGLLNLSHSKINDGAAVYVRKRSNVVVSMIDISRLKEEIRRMQGVKYMYPPAIIKVSEKLIKNIVVFEGVLNLLSKIYRIRPSASSLRWWYYVDEQKGYVYYLVVYHDPYWYDHVILFKQYLKYDNIMPSIIAYFRQRSTTSTHRQNLFNLLWSQITSLMAYKNGNQLNISKLLKGYAHRLNYNYMNEIIVEMHYPRFLFIGARHNRTMSFKYYNAEFTKIEEAHVHRSYNIIIWNIKALNIKSRKERENIDLYVPIVLSELTITKKLLADSSTFYS